MVTPTPSTKIDEREQEPIRYLLADPRGFIFIRALGELLIEKRRSVNKLHCPSNELLILSVFIDFCISIKK